MLLCLGIAVVTNSAALSANNQPHKMSARTSNTKHELAHSQLCHRRYQKDEAPLPSDETYPSPLTLRCQPSDPYCGPLLRAGPEGNHGRGQPEGKRACLQPLGDMGGDGILFLPEGAVQSSNLPSVKKRGTFLHPGMFLQTTVLP